jgi:hypothetical protein
VAKFCLPTRARWCDSSFLARSSLLRSLPPELFSIHVPDLVLLIGAGLMHRQGNAFLSSSAVTDFWL